MTTQVIQIIVAALTGGLAGAFVRYFLDRRSEKRRAVLDFYWRVFLEREFRKHFHYVRPIRVAWPQDKSVLQHFLDLPSDQKPKETECPNDLTPHQNLSILLNFWGVLYVSLRDGALDESLTRSLFGNVWQWHDNFHRDFLAAYQAEAPSKRPTPDPIWVAAIPFLHEFFNRPSA